MPFEANLAGRLIRGRVWGEGPLVYLVHGWGGSAEQLTGLVPGLLARGLRVVAFDGLSHGLSDAGAHGPSSSDAVELGRCLDAVAAQFGPARAIVAHSLGALATMLALRDGWVSTERIVLVAPVEGVPDFMRRLRAQHGFGPRVERRLAARAAQRTGYPVDELDMARLGDDLERQAGVEAPARPLLLVIHDADDRETPHEGSATLVRGWPGAQLWSTFGLGHRRILADPAVAAAVARFAARGPVDELLHAGERPQPLLAVEGARASRVA